MVRRSALRRAAGRSTAASSGNYEVRYRVPDGHPLPAGFTKRSGSCLYGHEPAARHDAERFARRGARAELWTKPTSGKGRWIQTYPVTTPAADASPEDGGVGG